jgi:hypothetical protein
MHEQSVASQPSAPVPAASGGDISQGGAAAQPGPGIVDWAALGANAREFLQRKWIRGLPIWVFVAGAGLLVVVLVATTSAIVGSSSGPVDACNRAIHETYPDKSINKGSVTTRTGMTKGGYHATFVRGYVNAGNGAVGRVQCTVNDDGAVTFLSGDYMGVLVQD